AAMKKGKHVFCQKPMTHTIYEARRMAEVARETGVASQVAVGNQASEDTRLLCEWIEDGAIGPVRHVITGPAVHSGRRDSIGRRRRSRFPKDWIGTCGWDPHRSVPSIMSTCRLSGAVGTISAVAPWET